MKYFNFTLVFLLAIGCSCSDSNNSYNTILPGSELSVNHLKRAEQIVMVGDKLVLLIDVSNNKGEYYNPHLFFFDSNLTLASEAYYASEMIDSVKEKKIFGVVNNTRLKRMSQQKDNLPAGYTLQLIDNSGNEGTMNYCKIVIKRISLLGLSDTAMIIIDRYDKILIDTVAVENRNFKTDTLLLPLAKLKINYNSHMVSTKKIDMGYTVWEEMYLKDSAKMDSFYIQVYHMLKNPNRR
jgi:hypothetical protein